MRTAVKLNGVELEHKDGLIYTDNLNETLDSGIVVCEAIDKLDITPLDRLHITFPEMNFDRTMVVSSYEEEVASYNPPKYNYVIQYASPTLLMERITLPNLSIKKVYKTENDEDWLIKEGDYYVRSVAYYIHQYMREYFNLGDWMLNADIELLAMDTICPEMSFDRPNLKEVMNALLQTMDYIFYLDGVRSGNNDIYFIRGLNPNITNNAIDTTKLDRDVVKQNANYYASNLDIELTNSISNKTTKSIQYLTPRTDGAILTTDNAALILQNSIYDIEKIEIQARIFDKYITDSNGDRKYLDWVDITKHVVEKSVYEGLKVGVSISYTELQQINTLYFTQGDNKIEGLGKLERFAGIYNTGTTLTNLLASAFHNLGLTINPSVLDDIEEVITKNLTDIIFRVTYQTQQDVKMQTEKTIKTKHYSSLFDSQDSKFVNVELFGKNSLNTINKLGNPERTINAIYNNFSEVPQLGDYIGNYILTTRTISIYDNYIVFEGLLTENYADKYQFNAIDSKKRFYNISDETLVRHESIKKYCVFEFNNDSNGDKTLANSILNFNDLTAGYATLIFDFGNNRKSASIISEVSTYQQGNSVGIAFGFSDNIVVGNSRGEKGTGGYYQEPVKYVNDYGENYGVEINIHKNMVNKKFNDKDEYIEFSENVASLFPLLLHDSEFLTTPLYTANSNYHKDQSEIQKWTLQYTFVSNNNRIVLGEGLYEYNSFLNPSQDFKIIKSSKPFNIRNNGELDMNYVEIIEDKNNIIISDNGIMFFRYTGNIGLALNNKLVFGVNDYVSGNMIYLNIRDTR